MSSAAARDAVGRRWPVSGCRYEFARPLAETVGKLKVPDAVLDRFEAICKAVNATLVRSGEK